MAAKRFVVESGFCSWHVWERIAPNTKQRVDAFCSRREARQRAKELNEAYEASNANQQTASKT